MDAGVVTKTARLSATIISQCEEAKGTAADLRLFPASMITMPLTVHARVAVRTADWTEGRVNLVRCGDADTDN